MKKNKIINMTEHRFEAGLQAVEALNKAGYEAYFVGGCIRDAIMNRQSPDMDLDITTNALPEEVKEVFKDYNVIETGIKHGTVTVMVQKNTP